jgi:hypothetical protein
LKYLVISFLAPEKVLNQSSVTALKSTGTSSTADTVRKNTRLCQEKKGDPKA